MRIGLITFDISKIGGIETYRRNITYGLEKLGHEPINVFVTNTKTKPNIEGYDVVLGYITDDLLKEYKKYMEDMDALIFIHPNPHNTKSFSSDKWKECYIEKPTLVCLHDVFLLDYNRPILGMLDKINCFISVQPKSSYLIKQFTNQVIETGHPIDLTDAGLYDEYKEDLVILPNQFRSWKHNDIFVRSVPYIDSNIKKEVYSSGIEYHKMSGKKRNPAYGNIWDVAIDKGMIYKGHVNNEEKELAFKRSKCVVNMATFENYNKYKDKIFGAIDYTQFESMKYGSIPIGRRINIDSGLVTEDNILVVNESDIERSLASNINDVVNNWDSYKDMRMRNLELLKKYDATKVVNKMLNGFKYDKIRPFSLSSFM